MKANVKKAIELMGGKEPINEIGSCFDATFLTFFHPIQDRHPNDKLCHGIGVANMPGQEGKIIGHAWIEFDHNGERLAYDAIWGMTASASKYRADFQLNYIVEYTYEQAFKQAVLCDCSGPWDLKIREITNKEKQKQ